MAHAVQGRPSACDGGDWRACRRQLVAEMFGTDGDLPATSKPSWVNRPPRDWDSRELFLEPK